MLKIRIKKKLDELEPFQRKVRQNHVMDKRELVGPNAGSRSKSAPPLGEEVEEPVIDMAREAQVVNMLYHGTRGPLFYKIAKEGLKSQSGFSNFGEYQDGISVTTNFDVVKTGQFGNIVLVLSGEELRDSGGFDFEEVQHPTASDEDEIRIVAIDSSKLSGSGLDYDVDTLETIIPFNFVRQVILLYKPLRGDIKDLKKNFPEIEFLKYDRKTDELESLGEKNEQG